MSWLTNENNSAILEQQAEAQEQTARLEMLIGRVSVHVLGPALVATVFGASPTWFDEHQGLRAVLMFVAMIGVAGTGWILIRRLNAAPDQTIGPLSTPVYGWALKLGAQINQSLDQVAPTLKAPSTAAPEVDASVPIVWSFSTARDEPCAI